VRERVRGSEHMLHTREKQTRRFAALSEHQHASTRLGVQRMNALDAARAGGYTEV
jgi:hypothetical protein